MTTPAARAKKFARFIDEVLKTMRADGMTNADIERATGISKSTFYRWRDGDMVNLPRPDQVWDFCIGLGIPPDAAGGLLGWTNAPDAATPMLPPVWRKIQQALDDPAADPGRKAAIRELLRAAANLADIADTRETTEIVL